MADPSDLLKGGELVLTTGIGAGERERDQSRWIASLLEQGVAAVAVELGSTWRERVPEPVVRACSDADVPLVAFRRQVRFIEITEAVHSAVLNNHPMSVLNAFALEGLADPTSGAFAALVGGNLGPRLLPVGSLAALLWYDLLRKHGVQVPVTTFIRAGVLLTAPPLAVSLLVLWLLHM